MRKPSKQAGRLLLSMTTYWGATLVRGMHNAVLRHLAKVGTLDLRKISEPLRQRLIDLAMREPPLVYVDADQVSLTLDGHKAAEDLIR